MIVMTILLINSANNKIDEQNTRDWKLKIEMTKTLAYADNYARILDEISKVADQSYSDVKKAYDVATGERISRQLALDNVYVIKEWIDKAKVKTEKWPNMNRTDIEDAFTK